MKFSLLLFVIIVLSSCNALKRSKLMRAGEVSTQVFTDSVQFNFDLGFPILKVEVNGIESSFLFDTGAPNVVSYELAQKLNLKTKATGNISDSGGNISRKEKYVNLDNVRIGQVDFKNTGAVVLDLNSAHKIKCLGLDGIIGANLMRKVFWKIDYQNQILKFTNDLETYGSLDSYHKINFQSRFTGTPLVYLKTNPKDSVRMTIDTGSNGRITLPYSTYQRPSDSTNLVYCLGTSTYGINGKAMADSTFYSKIDKLKMGSIGIDNKIMQYRGDTDLIGNDFLKNYSIIFDWVSHTLYFKQISEFDFTSLNRHGFKMDMENEKMVVSALFNNSNASKVLEMGDEILKIDDRSYENISDVQFCDFVKENSGKHLEKDVIHIVVKRAGKLLEYDISKSNLIR